MITRKKVLSACFYFLIEVKIKNYQLKERTWRKYSRFKKRGDTKESPGWRTGQGILAKFPCSPEVPLGIYGHICKVNVVFFHLIELIGFGFAREIQWREPRAKELRMHESKLSKEKRQEERSLLRRR